MSSRVSSRLVRGSVLAALSFAALTSPQLATERLGAQSAPAQPARPVFADGQAQIVPAFEDEKLWIRQTLWVETEFDSDGDGRRDRMFVDVTRPRQTDTEGLKVPVHLRVVAVLRRDVRQPPVPVGREAGARRAAAAAHVADADRVQGRRARTSRPRSSPRGCRAASRSCTRMRPAPDCPRDARRSAPTPSSWRRRR